MPVQLRGISYDADSLVGDLEVIRDELHCNAVLVFGRDLLRLAERSAEALELGLDVWFQPRLADRPRGELLAHLAQGAAHAEALRAAHPGRVVFVAGCEHSLFSPGMIPGPRVVVRLQLLGAMRWLRPRVARRLDPLLRDAAATARAGFGGPVTYAAAAWEDVDWSRFDLVAVNLYRSGDDAGAYAQRVHALVRGAGKPIVISEFGCGAYRGGEWAGPAGFRIVNWWADPPRVRAGHVRDEATQAEYLRDLVAVFEAAGVHGAFAFTYAMPSFRHVPGDPLHDLDMAGFGVVAVGADGARRPKAAFHALAERYARLRSQVNVTRGAGAPPSAAAIPRRRYGSSTPSSPSS